MTSRARTLRIAPLAVATAGLALVAACGSSAGSKAGGDLPANTPTAPATTPATTATPTAGTAGFDADFVCAAVESPALETVLGSGYGEAKPQQIDPGVNSCAWVSGDEDRAVVAVLFDDASAKESYDSAVKLGNKAAGTSFPTATYTTIDVGARNVTVYALTEHVRVPSAGLSTIANQVNDAVVDADQAG